MDEMKVLDALLSLEILSSLFDTNFVKAPYIDKPTQAEEKRGETLKKAKDFMLRVQRHTGV